MMPIVDGLEAEFGDQVMVLRLNAAEPANADLQTQYDLLGHPGFAIIDAEGVVRQRFFGPQEEGVLRAAMAAVAEG